MARTWVTRRGVQVDRISSAWLIRRFIDPEASFHFVGQRELLRDPSAIRFDMFDGEFTHQGDRCTFEVLLEHTGLHDPALQRIGEIVHDLDLKDSKFRHPEASGVASLIAGLVAAHTDDFVRIERGIAAFDALYASFQRSLANASG